ncbi:MAG TPA: ABC transporter permease [Sumerlaeia bacterium]|nr:ABC transporter permease [Sumerlaeia bacterium]
MPDEVKEQIREIWQNWYFQDALVACLLLGFALLVWRLGRRAYWRLAVREVMQRRLAVVSFFIVCLYAAVALLDSVGWHPQARSRDGEPLFDPQGKRIRDSRGISVLDSVCADLRDSREKTYSAPLAAKQFTSEIMIGPDGRIAQGHPDLRYSRKHLLGTDKVGGDVFYVALKGIRTGMILGGLTTLLAIPFAILFGVVAGYFGGWVDDVIQYVYTVLASIPRVLMVVAFMVIFGRGLPQLCAILGISTWTGLCRVLRGETLKLRETEYVQAAEATGVARWRILARHIVPNVFHVVLITAVLSFSGMVLAEAALTYIGIGVGADTYSWGRMINDARMELARDPVVWWKLAAAFIFMLGLVLPANIFGDAVRDALDPRLRTQ